MLPSFSSSFCYCQLKTQLGFLHLAASSVSCYRCTTVSGLVSGNTAFEPTLRTLTSAECAVPPVATPVTVCPVAPLFCVVIGGRLIKLHLLWEGTGSIQQHAEHKGDDDRLIANG
jgi:hypothetical protein